MNKKKVLIISPNLSHKIGGREKYIDKITKIFLENKWDVTEVSVCWDKQMMVAKQYNSTKIICTQSKAFESKWFNYWRNISKAFREIEQLISSSKYDLVIDNEYFSYKKNYNANNRIVIQHNDPSYYDICLSHSRNRFLTKLILPFLHGLRSPIVLNKNVIFYNRENKDYASFRFNKQYSTLPNIRLSPVSTQKILKSKFIRKEKKIVYIGRIEKSQKNIKFLVNVAKYLKYPIDVYGGGLLSYIKNKKNIKYCGIIDGADVLKTFSKYLASIIVSKFEGLCFSCIESLSSGTPTIVRDTFCSAKELTSTGLLLDKKLSPKQCAKRINEYLDNLDSKKAFKDCQELALKNYTEEVFTKKWNDIIKNYEHYLHT